ncbi:MAG TPA: TonB-dependent receptor plug domain-containing protein, partial [Gemmatimonadaceae bacterium]|nr:TonB-dependent receptor plug domain-containing protein [Gemmatimonadaceae bacterium]
MPVRFSALVFASYLFVAAPLGAQQATVAAPVDTARADTAGAPRALERVRVTAARPHRYAARSTRSATRTDTPLRDIPQSATVLTREVLADQSVQSMADVVRYMPGITMGLGEGHR